MAVGDGAHGSENYRRLKWEDCDLLNREIHLSRTYTMGKVDGKEIGDTATKSGEPRTIDLTPPAAAVLEGWWVKEIEWRESYVFLREDGGRSIDSADCLAPGALPRPSSVRGFRGLASVAVPASFQ